MHTIKDVTEHVFRLVTGRDDNQKVRSAELALGRSFTSQSEPTPSSLTVKSRGKRPSRATLPSSTFSSTQSQCEIADTDLLSIALPTHVDYTPKKMFSTTTFAHMKSHDWKQFISQGMFKYSVKGLLGNAQQESLFCFKQNSCRATRPIYIRQGGRRHELCSCGHGKGLSSNTSGTC